MSFTLDPTVPADSETPRNGASRIRSLTGEVLELFGETGFSPITYALPPIATVDHTTGLATVQGVPTTSLGIATKGYVDASTPSNVFVGQGAGTNTLTTTLAPVPASQAALAGFVIHVRIANTNTGATTFNPNGLGALAIVKNGNNALGGGELVAGSWMDLTYDTTNTNYQIIGIIPAAAPSLIVPQIRAYKATDQTVTSSTTLVNDSNLSFAIAANEVWQFEIDLYATFDGGAASGIKAAFTVPSGATLQWVQTNTTAPQTTSGSSLVLATGGGSVTTYMNKLIGQALNGATPGTVQLQWAQNTSNGTATAVKAGSSLLATRMNP
jgi:hypothetical protein